eukprot:CAMPEP_0170168324 /NCGR_PEP_ID=MMETSP0040_2-20121228/1410_1 /TAXON_ID=641309 /ORGANISM="Lotharella oceanica, Strain CCMP622" /LENGTH=92 /DNA_ID=CAMNT_0010406555 /DNA_START=1916 /DNA_END=2194 /DNA_ORIENTATION=+
MDVIPPSIGTATAPIFLSILSLLRSCEEARSLLVTTLESGTAIISITSSKKDCDNGLSGREGSSKEFSQPSARDSSSFGFRSSGASSRIVVK